MMQQNMSAEEMGRIWDRVAPPPPPPPPERPDGTEELLRAAADAALLRTLYGRLARGRNADLFRAMQREAARTERFLLRELFIMSGDIRELNQSLPPQRGQLSELRTALVTEEGLERKLIRLGRDARRARGAYENFARLSRRRQARLEAMIDGMMR